jgi:hypothetical protein
MKKSNSRKQSQKIDREAVENAMLDTMRLRAALLLACTELCNGDPLEGWGLAEEFYDQAPALIANLTETGQKQLPCGPAQVLQFPTKPDSQL